MADLNFSNQTYYSTIGMSIGHPTEVGSYPPNQWGLYNMHGNVWEWVSAWYGPHSPKDSINPTGPTNGNLKVLRGGSWYFGDENARSCNRRTHNPVDWGFSIGFRIVCEKNLRLKIPLKFTPLKRCV